MKVQAPFEVRMIEVPTKTGQAAGSKVYVIPVRYTKVKFLGDIKSRIGNYCVFEQGAQFIGWLNQHAGRAVWRKAGL